MIGLSSAEATKRLQQYGPNVLPEQRPDGLLLIFARQFNSPFIYVLLVAALISFGLRHTLNGFFILAVLVLNAAIGTVQEFSAQKAATALKKMVPQFAAVIRDGIPQRLNAAQLVPGDIVELATGDRVPADLHLHQCDSLLINESALTGESLSAAKQVLVEVPTDAPLAERTNDAFAGTIVTHGRGQGEVTATGRFSQIGQIATEIGEPQHAKPPLLQRIERFTLSISLSVLVVVAVIFLISLFRGADLASVFLLGVALAVSAIPEGLPAAITIALAIGMRRMARVNVIVRKLIAVEALGSCTYIASDKTGTLTVNELTVRKLVLTDGSVLTVTGEGLDMHGEILTDHTLAQGAIDPPTRQKIDSLVRAGMLANEATLTLAPRSTRNRGLAAETSSWQAFGDGVDLAFLVLAAKQGFDHQRARSRYPELGRIPYESENAYSASANRVDGGIRLHVKGSAERVVAMCTTAAHGATLDSEAIHRQVADLGRQGYRVLALAGGELPDADLVVDQHLHGLEFLGLVAMIDPLRPEAQAAVEQCHSARIQVAMITGDHPETALAIARELKLVDDSMKAVTGADLALAASQGQDALSAVVASTRVFARVEPTQKLQIVEQLIRQGEFVAVTGDGVNDAPALRQAHVGIAMGKRGTDVARESAELILTDDNFASIVQGVEQGRIVYNNIRKVVFLLISTGAAEIVLFILSVLFNSPIPLFPTQLLWLNLVTNGIQDVALAFEPAEGDELQRPPKRPKETIFNRLMLERVLLNALFMGSCAFGVFATLLHDGHTEESARNLTLLLMVLFENVHVFNSRSETLSIFRQRLFGNPFLLFGMLGAQAIHIAALYTPGLSDVLQVQPVNLPDWLGLLALALLLVVVNELYKFWNNRRGRLTVPTPPVSRD